MKYDLTDYTPRELWERAVLLRTRRRALQRKITPLLARLGSLLTQRHAVDCEMRAVTKALAGRRA